MIDVMVLRIDRSRVQQLMQGGAQVFDALPSADYSKQHLPGATSVPVEKFSPDLLRAVDRHRATVTYCADNECDLGARLAALLVSAGFNEVYEYAASLADWSAYGLPLEGDSADVTRAGDLARREFPTCRPYEVASTLQSQFAEHSVCVVLDDDGVLLGSIVKDGVKDGGDAPVRDFMQTGPSTFQPDVPIDDMAKWFEKRTRADFFIITTPDGHPVGILYRADTENTLRRDSQRVANGSARG